LRLIRLDSRLLTSFFCKFQNEKARKAALEAEISALNKEKSKVEAALAKKTELLEIAKKSIKEGKRMSYIVYA
jgi:hypothetical protein